MKYKVKKSELWPPLLPGLFSYHTITQWTRWITTTISERTSRHRRVSNHPKTISWDHQLSQPRHAFFPAITWEVYTNLACCYVLIDQMKHSVINYAIQIPITQKKDPRLPVSYCFQTSSPLFMEDYNIHTTHLHIPQGLPLTTTVVVPIICRSIFEHTKHLDYSSSRPWCHCQFLWSFIINSLSTENRMDKWS